MIRTKSTLWVGIVAMSISALSCSTLRSAQEATQKKARQIGRSLGIIDEPSLRLPKSAPAKYQEAVTLLEQDKFAESLEAFDIFLRDEPTSAWTQAAILNSGRALEGLGRWADAKDRYRRVIAATSNAPRLQAMALYRRSFVHEALSEDPEAVAVLNDLLNPNQNRAKNLPPEVARAELPARLAGAYARVGNFEKALESYQLAERGIAALRRESGGKKLPYWYPRTLYYMGSMSLRKVTWDDFDSALRPLSRSQVYLLQAAELGVEPWAGKSSRDLIATYRELWTAIETAPKSETADPIVGLRSIQEKQWERVGLVEENLQELRARILPTPESDRTAQSKEIFGFIADLEKKIRVSLEQRPLGEGLTNSSAARRRAVRGRVVSPDDTLERQFLDKAMQESRKTRTLPKAERKVEDPPAPIIIEPVAIPIEAPAEFKDPNL